MSQRKVQDTITYLEKRGLIKRLQAVFGGASKGNLYWVPFPNSNMAPDANVAKETTVADVASVALSATAAPPTTVAPRATNKYDDDDDDLKDNHHQSVENGARMRSPVENPRPAAAPRERQKEAVKSAYERLTGNRWNKADSASYSEHELDQVPVERIISVLESITRRTPSKINSFKYFIKEILAKPDPRNHAWQKRQLAQVVSRVRENSVGRADYSNVDFLEDVKCACARDAISFNDDLFNELAG